MKFLFSPRPRKVPLLALIVFGLTAAGMSLLHTGARSLQWFPPRFAVGAFLLAVAVLLVLLSACS
jgi:hypothetical protein